MSLPVGGRGKKAPYETIVLRVPSPLVPEVQKMINDYRDFTINGQVNKPDDQLENVLSSLSKDLPQALEEARRIVKSKKSSAESLAKLLQVLYGAIITKEDLKD